MSMLRKGMLFQSSVGAILVLFLSTNSSGQEEERKRKHKKGKKRERRKIRRKKGKEDIWYLIDTIPISPRAKSNNHKFSVPGIHTHTHAHIDTHA